VRGVELDRLVWAAKAAAHRIAGKCPDCGAERGERSRCPIHLAVHAARERRRRAAQ
jgi:hypothetical protein